MFTVVSANVVNLFGNWVLIYGHLGFRAMGTDGSAWATCAARVYMVGVLVCLRDFTTTASGARDCFTSRWRRIGRAWPGC